MVDYRQTIYEQYFSNQVNKSDADPMVLLEQQSYYYGKELVPFLPANKDAVIIDLGCGFGSMVHAARSNGYSNVSGIDMSPEQVETARKLGIEGIEQLTIEDLLSSERSFDCIVGIDIIEHFTKDELINFLVKCKTLLKPGGRVIFRTPNMDAPQASVYAHADISHECFLNKSSALQVMASTGYSNVNVHPSMIHNRNAIKEVLRKALWSILKLRLKIELFASGRTWNDVVFTPNLIIEATT